VGDACSREAPRRPDGAASGRHPGARVRSTSFPRQSGPPARPACPAEPPRSADQGRRHRRAWLVV